MGFLDNLNIPDDQRRDSEAPAPVPLVPTTDTMSMEELFERMLPESLYMTHYELNSMYPHHSAEAWRRFIKEKDRFIMQETAIVTEANARKALKRLGAGDLKQGDATAIGQLLKQSEQINQSVKDKTTYVTMFLPDPKTNIKKEKGIAEQVKENKQVVSIFYPNQVYQIREMRGELVMNADGTLHFPKPEAITHLDKIYMHFHNKDNEAKTEIVDGDLDWQ